MAARRVRIRDVAAAAGVSATTTSFVLNGRDKHIPQATRQRVLDAASRMGYRPNASARALATGRTQRLGVVLNTPYSLLAQSTYHTGILAGILGRAPQQNYNLLIYAAQYPDWRLLYEEILSGASDGVLLVGRNQGTGLTSALLDAGFPTVCLSYRSAHPDCCFVDCDNEAGAWEAARHLLANGYRRLLLDYPGETMSWGTERRQGVERALAEAGLPASNLTLVTWNDAPLSEQIEAHIAFCVHSAAQAPTAVITCDELRGQMLAEILPLHGLRVPDDIGIVTFNSTEISARTRPPLTSVGQPLGAIGAAAVEMLARLISKEQSMPCELRFPMTLDVRASSVPSGLPASVSLSAANNDVISSEETLP